MSVFIFLPPFAPSELPDFFATIGTLTTVRGLLCCCFEVARQQCTVDLFGRCSSSCTRSGDLTQSPCTNSSLTVISICLSAHTLLNHPQSTVTLIPRDVHATAREQVACPRLSSPLVRRMDCFACRIRFIFIRVYAVLSDALHLPSRKRSFFKFSTHSTV